LALFLNKYDDDGDDDDDDADDDGKVEILFALHSAKTHASLWDCSTKTKHAASSVR